MCHDLDYLSKNGINSVTETYKKCSNRKLDTMPMLLFHDNFVKPWSEEVSPRRLLTKLNAFFWMFFSDLLNASLCVHVSEFPLS